MRKERQDSSSIEDNNVFDEGLDDSNYINIFYNCFKNLEANIIEIFDSANTTNKNQTKSTRHLESLTDAVDFIRKKFEHYETESWQRDDVIKSLREKVSTLYNNLENLELNRDKQEQYLPRSCLLIHGISENKHKTNINRK